MAKSRSSQDSGTFFGSDNSTFKYLYKPCKVPPLFPLHKSAQERTEKRKNLNHFAWPLEVLNSGILKIWKKCQNPEIFRKWKRTPLLTPRHSHSSAQLRIGLKKLRHFTWPVRKLKSGISQIRKKFQNLEIPRIMAIFSDLPNSTFSTLTGHEKSRLFCHLGALTHIRRTARPEKI